MNTSGMSRAMMSRAATRRIACSRLWPRSFSSAAVADVRKGMEIDASKVLPLLVANGSVTSAEAAAPLDVKQFGHGQSNPTYLVNVGSRPLVLRKQPPGKLLRGAHAVDREFMCMSALGPTEVPVPKMLLFSEDAELLGTPFLVCEYVAGRFFECARMKTASSPQERAALYGAFIKACAAIHTVDYKSAGLGGFGKEGGYVARQTKVWTSQYRAAETEPMPAMERLLEWLPQALPLDDDLTTLVHGDLRVDNMIFDADRAEVIAVLDWELSTLGHPATDLALVTLPYDTPDHLPKALGGYGEARAALGVPAEQDLVDAYVEATGLSSVRTHLDYYRAFCCFRMASILQGVYKRSVSGQASAPDGEKIGKLASVCAELGVAAAERYTSQPDRLAKTAGAGAAFLTNLKPSGAAPVRKAAASSAMPAAMPEGEYEALKTRMVDFMHTEIYPNEREFARQSHAFSASNEWTHSALIIELMQKAKAQGLWNLFLPVDSAALVGGRYGAGLTNLQYADLCEIMGTSIHAEMAAQATNTTSPDTGNMETLARFGSDEQKERWLKPLLEGKIRSCFAMTEPDVASSDATNISISIRKEGGDYVINGRKWAGGGAGAHAVNGVSSHL